ncbi:hypothetical protein TNCV_831771 [Trichonephila clavipes]|nr:hypothetical protein TNCV_831771 [Trichonephila clavipes]
MRGDKDLWLNSNLGYVQTEMIRITCEVVTEVSGSALIPPTLLGRRDGEGATSGVSRSQYYNMCSKLRPEVVGGHLDKWTSLDRTFYPVLLDGKAYHIFFQQVMSLLLDALKVYSLFASPCGISMTGKGVTYTLAKPN